MSAPLELARQTAKLVCRGMTRKYYRFRPARFYGRKKTTQKSKAA